MRLTDSKIKALKPRKLRYYVGDGRGLWLEVFPSGAMSWRYRYRLRNKAEKIAIGRYPEIGLKGARQKRDRFASMVANGESPAAEKQKSISNASTAMTVREFGERYYQEVVLRDRKHPADVLRYLENEIYPAVGHKSLLDVSASDLQTIIFRKRDNGFESSAAQIRNLAKRLFDYAIVCGKASINPALATPTRFITRGRPRTRALKPEEIKVYLETLYGSNIRRQFKLALYLILLTLVRKSEMLLAKWSEINLESLEWTIPPENTKTGQAHVVYMSTQVAAIFRELRSLAGNSKWVFPGRGSGDRHFAPNAVNKALEGLNFELEPFTIHDLRRTGSTLLHEQGFSSDVIEKSLNHTIGGVRGVYNRAKYSDQRKAMLQHWANYIDSLSADLKLPLVRAAAVSNDSERIE
jgi:integrase